MNYEPASITVEHDDLEFEVNFEIPVPSSADEAIRERCITSSPDWDALARRSWRTSITSFIRNRLANGLRDGEVHGSEPVLEAAADALAEEYQYRSRNGGSSETEDLAQSLANRTGNHVIFIGHDGEPVVVQAED